MHAFIARAISLCRTPQRQWFVVFAVLALIYLPTSHFGPGVVTDNYAAYLPAHWFATHGTFRLDDFVASFKGQVGNPWFIHTPDGHIVSNRQPGIVLTTVPFAVVMRTGSEALGAVTAAIVTAAGMATLSLALRRLLGVRLALGAIAVAGLATSMWSVAADQLWPHTVNALWLALAVSAYSSGRRVVTGWAFAASILVRVHIAVAAAVIGLWEGMRQRSLRPVLAIGVPAAVGLVALVLWNRYYFDVWNLSGGYPAGYAVSARFGSAPGWQYPMRYIGMLFSPSRGVLVTSPFFLLLLLGLRTGWRGAPSWTRGSAVAGLVYLLVQEHINTYAGAGSGFYTYRYPLEALLLMAPLFAVVYARWVRAQVWRIRAFRALIVASLCFQAAGAALYVGYNGPPTLSYSPWRDWPFGDVLVSIGWVAGGLLAVLMAVVVVLTALLPVRRVRTVEPRAQSVPVPG